MTGAKKPFLLIETSTPKGQGLCSHALPALHTIMRQGLCSHSSPPHFWDCHMAGVSHLSSPFVEQGFCSHVLPLQSHGSSFGDTDTAGIMQQNHVLAFCTHVL